MKVLICGGRDFNDYSALSSAMKLLPFDVSMVIQGGARGADSLAKKWAISNGIHYVEVPALWDSFNKKAGSLRNAAMLSLDPGYCIALPGGFGTMDMVHKCIKAGVQVWEPYK